MCVRQVRVLQRLTTVPRTRARALRIATVCTLVRVRPSLGGARRGLNGARASRHRTAVCGGHWPCHDVPAPAGACQVYITAAIHCISTFQGPSAYDLYDTVLACGSCLRVNYLCARLHYMRVFSFLFVRARG